VDRKINLGGITERQPESQKNGKQEKQGFSLPFKWR
jgi:hypothetical protein